MKKKFNFKEFFRFMSLLKKRIYLYAFSLLCLELTLSIHPVIFSFIMKDMIDAAVDGRQEMLMKGVILSIILLVIRCILNPLFSYICSRTIRITTMNLKIDLFRKVESLPVDYLNNTHSGDIISTVTNDIRVVEDAMWNQMCFLTGGLLMGISSIIGMVVLEWRVAIALVVLGFFTTKMNLRFVEPIRTYSNRIQENISKINQYSKELFSGIFIIKIFQMGKRFLHKYDVISEDYVNNMNKRTQKNAELAAFNNCISTCVSFTILFGGLLISTKGYVGIGTVVAMKSLQGGILFAFTGIGQFVNQLQGSFAGADRIYKLLDLNSESQGKIVPDTDVLESEATAISCNRLTFAYDEKQNVLNNIDLTVNEGDKIFIAGASGCGKSTLIKLLVRFYQPLSGSICLYGKSINSYTLEEIRESITYITQEAYLFHGTIEENIKLGKLDATREEVIQAAKLANAHNFIEELEGCYDANVGENGDNLSGGEKQRIVLARAFLKNSPIILMDEATSALDSESERIIQQALEALTKGKTVISVTHRLKNIKNDDYVYMMKDGKIIESGTSNELLASKGKYFELYSSMN